MVSTAARPAAATTTSPATSIPTRSFASISGSAGEGRAARGDRPPAAGQNGGGRERVGLRLRAEGSGGDPRLDVRHVGTRYDSQRGYGWGPQGGTPWDGAARDTTFGGSLLQDFCEGGGYRFRVDVPAGRYRVTVWFENSGYWGGEQARHGERNILHNGVTVWSETRPDGPAHALYRFEDVEPIGVDLWDTYMADELAKPATFDVDVASDGLQLAVPGRRDLGQQDRGTRGSSRGRCEGCEMASGAGSENRRRISRQGSLSRPAGGRLYGPVLPGNRPVWSPGPSTSKTTWPRTPHRPERTATTAQVPLHPAPRRRPCGSRVGLSEASSSRSAWRFVHWRPGIMLAPDRTLPGPQLDHGHDCGRVVQHEPRFRQDGLPRPSAHVAGAVVGRSSKGHDARDRRHGDGSPRGCGEYLAGRLRIIDPTGKPLLRVPLELTVSPAALDRETEFLMGFFGLMPPNLVPAEDRDESWTRRSRCSAPTG